MPAEKPSWLRRVWISITVSRCVAAGDQHADRIGAFPVATIGATGWRRDGRSSPLQRTSRRCRAMAGPQLRHPKAAVAAPAHPDGKDSDARSVAAPASRIGDHDGHAAVRHLVELPGEVVRHAHAAMRGRIARHGIRFVQRDARPGQPLHERHRSVRIEVGFVILLLFENGKDAARRRVPGLAGRDLRASRPLRVAVIDRKRLLVLGNEDLQRAGIGRKARCARVRSPTASRGRKLNARTCCPTNTQYLPGTVWTRCLRKP